MARDLWVKSKEKAEEVARGEGGWEGIALGQVSVGTAFVPVVAQRFPIEQVFLAMI